MYVTHCTVKQTTRAHQPLPGLDDSCSGRQLPPYLSPLFSSRQLAKILPILKAVDPAGQMKGGSGTC